MQKQQIAAIAQKSTISENQKPAAKPKSAAAKIKEEKTIGEQAKAIAERNVTLAAEYNNRPKPIGKDIPTQKEMPEERKPMQPSAADDKEVPAAKTLNIPLKGK